MKNFYKATWLAVLGLASVSAVKAAPYNGDLIIGFTAGSGNDVVYDLGAASSLTSGETWDLSSILTGYDLSTISWGVIGTLNTGSPRTAWSTTDGTTPPANLPSLSAWGKNNTAISSIYQNFASAGAGQSISIDVSDDNSWNSQTINPSLTTQYANVYGNPNVVGATSDSLYSILANNSAPTFLGNFTLDNTGAVTFNPVPEPSTYGLLAVAGLLGLSCLKSFRRNQA
jgi:PEP-CTERM motif